MALKVNTVSRHLWAIHDNPGFTAHNQYGSAINTPLCGAAVDRCYNGPAQPFGRSRAGMIRNGLCGIGLSIGLGAVAVAPAAPTPKIDSQYVRANCTGVFKYSTTQHHVHCAIENVLEDADGTLIPGYSSAFADRRRGRLRAAAAGASVDDANYNGHQAAALFKDTLRISGDWSGPIPVTVSMWVHYRFEGIGDAQLWAQLSATETPRLTVRNRARIELRHGGTNRVQLTNAHSQGNFSAPENGPYEPQSLLILRVTQMVDA
ncbi:MAG: hypothetical protein OES09_16760, partial [Gammaproteobacteria bacterium]|nr:hypothetical protein [Gammaproteobacteria bacterium]